MVMRTEPNRSNQGRSGAMESVCSVKKEEILRAVGRRREHCGKCHQGKKRSKSALPIIFEAKGGRALL